MAERLNDIFNNPKYDDNTVIIRCLNTVLENGPSSSIAVYNGLGYFVKLFAELIKTDLVKRPDIEFIVENVQAINNNNSFDEFKKVLEDIYEQSPASYKYLFLMSYWRVLFEIFYEIFRKSTHNKNIIDEFINDYQKNTKKSDNDIEWIYRTCRMSICELC